MMFYSAGPGMVRSVDWRHDTQHNDTQHDDTQQNNTQHKDLICDNQGK